MDGGGGPRLGRRAGLTLDPSPINVRDHSGRPLERALRVGIVGVGDRGSVYARHLDDSDGKAVVGAIAEPRETIRKTMGVRYAIPQGAQFADWRDMVVAPRSCDAVVISLRDSEHLEAAMAFASAGYDILLEKPMAPTLAECRRIVAATEKANVWLGVCHVLRYTPYTSLVRSLVEGGAIGDIVNVQHLEPIGFWHFAHSYVRGNWRREATSAPVLLTKSSHDIDWLSYIIGQPATRVSSFGSLLHFRPEHAPEGAAERCLDCAVEDRCAYSAVRIYRKGLTPGLRESNFTAVVAPEYSEDALSDALRNGPYGRCVYGGQNDVADHQVVSIEYAGGITAGFTLTAFSPLENRRTRIFGTKGQITTDGSTVELFDFRSSSTTVHEVASGAASAGEGHAGGDVSMINAFVRALYDGEPSLFSSDGRTSLTTHEIVFAAEEARLRGVVVSLS